jgi:hypothetical protein
MTEERRVAEVRHCRHCYGDCQGACLRGGLVPGRCIHGWNEKPPRQFTLRRMVSRQWWHRVFWGAK